jgi:hypothetical protein
MRCNLCGVENADGFGTRMWNGVSTPLKICSQDREYFKEWRKAPGSKAKESERRHESKPSRQEQKRNTLLMYSHSEHGKAKRLLWAKEHPDSIKKTRSKYVKSTKGKTVQKRMTAKKYKTVRKDKFLWLKEKIRLKVAQGWKWYSHNVKAF